jgi:hypothetical protein
MKQMDILPMHWHFPQIMFRNYWYDNDYHNLYTWYNNLIQPDGFMPTLDDTKHLKMFNANFAILRKSTGKQLNFIDFSLEDRTSPNFSIREDYICAMQPSDKTYEHEQSVIMASGDAVFRSRKDIDLGNHYMAISNENDISDNGGYHEQEDDQGSFIIVADQDVLCFDPAYYDDGNFWDLMRNNDNFRDQIKKREHHNTLHAGVNYSWKNLSENTEDIIFFDYGEYGGYRFKKEFVCSGDCSDVTKKNYWARTYFTYRNENSTLGYYYLVMDNVELNNYSILEEKPKFTFNIHGNGDNNSYSWYNEGYIEWTYPCYQNPSELQKHSGLRAIVSSSVPSTTNYSIYDSYKHGSENAKKIPKGSSNWGKHITHITSVTSDESFTISTALFPRKCNSMGGLQKTVARSAQGRYSMFLINVDSVVGLLHLHIQKNNLELDTILDPFSINSSSILKTDADLCSFAYSINSEFKSGNCVSNCNFRNARIFNGKSINYNDTEYIESNKYISTDYSLIGKCKYRVRVHNDTACEVIFYLADVPKGVEMKVDGFIFTYDTSTSKIAINLPIGKHEFEIELEDPCRVSCFFPSTAETIDEQFDFNEGITQTLGHKLSIVQPHGFLNISKGSHMMLCNGIYLHNRDSLVLFSGCGKDTGQVTITTCNGEVTGKPYGQISGFGGGAKASRITVKIGAALILEDSSFTQISNNSELHVYGTLVIKKGAKLLIGDNRTCSYATIMVYPGAYVHIEDDAHLEFLKIIGDTHDRHIVFIANKPYGAGAQKGIATSILPLLQNDTIISSANFPIEICDLYTVTPTHGIANRDWGFCNLLEPKALIKIPNDTICEGECLLIDFKSSLNDPIREIEVCRIDSIMGIPNLTCFGTWRLEGSSLSAGYNESSKCYYSEAQLSYFPLCDYIDSTNSWFRLFVTVKNHCDQQDTQTVYFYVANKPNSLMAMADSACPGYGAVTAYNLSENNAEKAIWHVHLLDSTQYQENDENPFYYGGDWEQFNIHYGDSFTFPDFNWIGGFKYAVNLTQVGRCGEAVSIWDTIEIQPGAKIMASPSTVYSNPLGPSALQLQAFIGNANSFTWSPTTYLDNSNILNPIATPIDTITYFLATSNGYCAAFDTLYIKHNTLAFAGNLDTVCNEPVMLGTNFDASLFFAYQYVENPSGVWTEMAARLALDSAYFDKVSIYLLSEEGKNALQSIASYQNYLGALNRSQFYTQAWYLNFFRQYHANHNYVDAFTYFEDEVRANGSLTAYIGSNPMYHLAALQTFLDHFENEFFYGSSVQLTSVWEKYTQSGSNWESLGQWDNQIKMWDSVQMPTLYKITVIDNVNSKVEFDQVQIWSDQPTTPAFFVQFQTDSTLYFTNVSEPVQSSNMYAWNFGDGSSSNQTNPIHTFPFFDSTYVVCLTANNLCGTYSYCDTLRVDSTGLIGYSKNIVPPMITMPQHKNPSIELSNSYEAGIKVLAYPNPFNEELNVNYQIEISYQKGELRIQNTLGETLNKISFNGNSGQIQLSTQMLSSGLYTFQIILDGRLVQTGKLMRD